MSAQTTVFVGMSGGVDSSLTAYLLNRRGFRVVGLFMKNWEEPDGACNAGPDFEDVVSVCRHLGIDYIQVNFTEEYRERVFAEFLKSLQAGLTPNPDVLCNREIKFRALFDHAKALGADYLATGHYCRIGQNGGDATLLKGIDPLKDQSYFLHMVSATILKQVLFPLGEMTKQQVRLMAARANLPTAEKKESMGICFIGKRQFRPFLSRFLTPSPGFIVSPLGKKLGEHAGLGFYTIGQRRGLNIGGAKIPWFVADKDVKKNHLIAVQGFDHPDLFHNFFWVKEMNWIGHVNKELPLTCSAKIRYRSAASPCQMVSIDERGIKVRFERAERAITPGQSAVFYKDQVCLGGGIISSRWNG